MEIKLIDFDAEHYAANLTQREQSLKWESAGATHFVIVRAGFNTDIKLTQTHIEGLSKIEQSMLLSGVPQQIAGLNFTLLPRSGINVFPLSVMPAVYAVFACVSAENILTVYEPNDACFYQCAVLANVEVSVKRAPLPAKSFFEKVKELVKSEETQRQYYSVNIAVANPDAADSLCYSYKGCGYKYPVTAAMLNKTVLIPEFEGEPPRVESTDTNAYRIIAE